MGRTWNIIRGTIEQIIGVLIKLFFVVLFVLFIYFVWANFIKKTQTKVDRSSAIQQERLEKGLADPRKK